MSSEKFARLTRKGVLPQYTGVAIYINPRYIIAMADQLAGGSIIKIAIPDTGAANIPAPGVDPFGSNFPNAIQPTRMPFVTVQVAESVRQILEQIA
jgi:hypothetical protein